MPQGLIKSLEENKRPSPSLRRQMIHIVTNAIYKVCKKPGRKALDIVARKMLTKYPKSLADVLYDEVVEGHNSLQKQMETRFDNLNRLDAFNTLKRSIKSDDVSEDPKKKKKKYLSQTAMAA